VTVPFDSTPEPGAEITLDTVVEVLRSARRASVLTHRNPDGDAIGSATALAAGLRASGASVRIVCPDPLAPNLLGIPDADSVVTRFAEGDDDLVVTVDVSDPSLLQPLPAADLSFYTARRSVNIDHHISNVRYAQYNFVDPAAASAAEIVFQILRHMGSPIDCRMATQLLYGFVNDTHSFQNSNTTPRTLHMAADLVQAGADISSITFNLLLARSPAAARLWAQVLPTLAFADHGRLASLVVSLDALGAAGATLPDADGLVEFLRAIRGIDLGVLYKQIGPEQFRLSLRSSEQVDATAIAGRFGGGGHRRAAGCDVHGTLAAVQQRVLSAYMDTRATGDG
jgi:phosphoesterase RecJ-like protein